MTEFHLGFLHLARAARTLSKEHCTGKIMLSL